jgi:hypothetical protein
MHELALLENMRETLEKTRQKPDRQGDAGNRQVVLRRAGRLAVWLRYGHEGPVQCAGQVNPAIQIIKSSATKGDNFFDWLARNIKPASIATDYLEKG